MTMIVDKIKLNLCHIIRCDQKTFAINRKSQPQITNANHKRKSQTQIGAIFIKKQCQSLF